MNDVHLLYGTQESDVDDLHMGKRELILKSPLYLEEILGVENRFKGRGHFSDGSETIGFKLVLSVGTEQDPSYV